MGPLFVQANIMRTLGDLRRELADIGVGTL
jgi:hypothetical protein